MNQTTDAYSVVFAPLGAAVRPLGLILVGVVVAAIPTGATVTMRTEAVLLPRSLSGEQTVDEDETVRIPSLFAWTPSARIAARYLLRTRRDPRMISHLAPVVFGVFGFGTVAVTSAELAGITGPAMVILGAVLAGGAYCLNPLGDERDQLPLLLTSTRSVAVLLRGRALAGMLLGLVLAIGVGTPLAFVTGSRRLAIAQTLFAPVLVATTAGAALGIGALVPRFEHREFMNVERAHPSQIAVLGVFFGGITVGGAGMVLVSMTLDGAASMVLVLGEWAVYLTGIGAGGIGGYSYAVRKLTGLTLDDT